MKVIVIGGSGHIGTYLVPMLVREGHEVIMVSRGRREPYIRDWAWEKAEHVSMNRSKDPAFVQKIADMNGDIVIDLICFELDEVKEMVAALKQTDLSHYLYCSTIWTHGRVETLPVEADSVKKPLDEYGRQKYLSEQYLMQEFRKNNFPVTIVSPGQICGPGWSIISPLGYGDDSIFQTIAEGKEICLPNFGMETLHPVHAEDVAQVFFKSVKHRKEALGENFHAVSADALTIYGFTQAMYRLFRKEPRIEFLPWDQWCEYVQNDRQTSIAYHHLARSGMYSIENAKQLIGYSPRYTSVQVVEASIQSYIDRGVISVD